MENLKEILEQHKLWLNNEGGKRADLSGANLSRANLSGANLSRANLSRANLSEANLSEVDLSGANLSGAFLLGTNLSRTDLSWANLSWTNLSEANLLEANLDYSIINLSCKDLNHHIDDRLAIQRLYHLLKNVQFSKNTSEELKKILLTNELIDLANQFHRVDGCGKIINYREG